MIDFKMKCLEITTYAETPVSNVCKSPFIPTYQKRFYVTIFVFYQKNRMYEYLISF